MDPLKIATSEQMRSIDRRASEELGIPSIILMENAAIALADALMTHFPDAGRVTIFCGTGQNGGDGFALARQLDARGIVCEIFVLGERSKIKGDSHTNLEICERMRLPLQFAGSSRALEIALESAASSDVVVDAIFGTGLSRPPGGLAGEAITQIGTLVVPVLSVDLPSGLDASSSLVTGPAIHAAVTVSFALPKICHVFSPAADHCGEVIVADISIPQAAIDAEGITLSLISPDEVRLLLPERLADAHKGSFGHVAIVAGSEGKSGAAILAARGSLRGGAGLTTVVTDRKTARIVSSSSAETMTHASSLTKSDLAGTSRFLEKMSAVAVGPGLADDEESHGLIRELVSRIEQPLVLDATAVNAFAAHPEAINPTRRTRILTPHPGELARLLETTSAEIQQNRIAFATAAARLSNAIVVLKGHQTLVASPEGEVAVNPTGNAGMATGGMGDVLTGLAAALLAQGLDAWNAARAAVYLHGLAGDLLRDDSAEIGLAALDLADRIPHAVRLLREGPPGKA